MTVAVFDGVTIASDSQQTGDGIIPYAVKRKFCAFPLGSRGLVVATCGTANWCDAFTEYIGGTRKARPLVGGTDQGAALVFDGREWRKHYADSKFSNSTADKWALGSGAAYAEAALVLGHDAITAVYAACQLDPYSGGAIFHANINELLAFGNEAIQQMSHDEAKRAIKA
jgi:hypothetical protein